MSEANSTQQPSSSNEANSTQGASSTQGAQRHPFQAEVSQVLKLVVNSLYSHKEIFLRELISNASDALDKLRFRLLSEPNLAPEGTELRVRVIPDQEKKTLTLSDNGIGMTEAELIQHLGTIAHSGTRAFAEQMQKQKAAGDVQLIGQFGVGFYSAFLVADRVEVVSRAAGSDAAFRWTSDAKESFTIEPAERAEQGTDVILHLQEEHKEFAQGYRLRELIGRYSDYLVHPIEMPKLFPAAEKDKEGESTKETASQFERVNQEGALWQKNPKDVSEEQYAEFYKHLSRDWEKPLAHRHFHVEGTQLFSGLVFLPRRPPFDLFDTGAKHGVRLHVKRVFVMDDCEELLPKHLRFVKGLIDSEDLPLNVSREILQDSRAVRVIKKQVANHVLSMVEELEKEHPEDFKTFWAAFGPVLKEGLHYGEDKTRLSKLVRFRSTASNGELVSLTEYVGRMKEGQAAIYYAVGHEPRMLEASPHLERLKKHGYEVLLLTDPVDPFAVTGIGEFEDKPLVNAMEEKIDLPTEENSEEQEKRETAKKESAALIERFKSVLEGKVSEVQLSDRLTDSAVCLVIPEGGVAPHIERMMRAHNNALPETKRILEVNPSHPVIQNLKTAHEADATSDRVADWIALLYDQALIAEGSPLEDPAAFTRRMSSLMQSVAV